MTCSLALTPSIFLIHETNNSSLHTPSTFVQTATCSSSHLPLSSTSACAFAYRPHQSLLSPQSPGRLVLAAASSVLLSWFSTSLHGVCPASNLSIPVTQLTHHPSVEIFKSNRPVPNKVIWALVVFIFPVVGMIIYYLFSNRDQHNSGGYEAIGSS